MSTNTTVTTKLHQVVNNHGYFKIKEGQLSTRENGRVRRLIILIKSKFKNSKSYDKLAVAEAVVKAINFNDRDAVRGDLEALRDRMTRKGTQNPEVRAVFNGFLNSGEVEMNPLQSGSLFDFDGAIEGLRVQVEGTLLTEELNAILDDHKNELKASKTYKAIELDFELAAAMKLAKLKKMYGLVYEYILDTYAKEIPNSYSKCALVIKEINLLHERGLDLDAVEVNETAILQYKQAFGKFPEVKYVFGQEAVESARQILEADLKEVFQVKIRNAHGDHVRDAVGQLIQILFTKFDSEIASQILVEALQKFGLEFAPDAFKGKGTESILDSIGTKLFSIDKDWGEFQPFLTENLGKKIYAVMEQKLAEVK